MGQSGEVALDPDADGWQLPIVGFEVCDVWFSGQLYVIAYGDGDLKRGLPAPRTQIALGGPFLLRSSDGNEHRLNAEEPWDTLVPVLSLRHAHVVAAAATRNGALGIRFEDGSALSAEPDPHYENWAMSGPEGLNLVAPPGGGDPRISS
jgi:hypothetical protein